ncbi:MAG: alpha/beta hydrolase [Desulfarculaceae bacterium]|nr:alpha/beta hydrolase [Desulfarculaceae bacterium]MCF8071237.1 alpha/beta hydrolase [Desulfarculaceae bacterium]MCF8101160.1 alpha/beta hydrolase [Desulfarculaceae bacterium]MCF8115291.1 alpha/beta hydrolase [Desulfarculaceae bacterium]
MARYFFVPGGKRTASDWDQVRAILETAGHQTRAITLSDPKQASLEGHVSEVERALAAWGPEPVRLVGHSYASLVITGAAAARPTAIQGLGYVDCLIPASGLSLFDFFCQAGQDPAASGVPAWPPFTQPLVFDQSAVTPLPKLYVHCLRSQFLSLTQQPVRRAKEHAQDEHWQYREIDADHYVMLNHAPKLAAILKEM